MSTRRALIVGGGIGGMSAAIALQRRGVQIDLIDLDPKWRVYGAGITITGPTLRAFKVLGVLDEILAHGFAGNGIRVCAVDGSLIEELPTPQPADSDVPGSGGIMRPTLHRILSERVLADGIPVRLGITVDALSSSAHGVAVQFSDGTRDEYDLVVGADGLYSRVRGLLFPNAPKPAYTGQSCWRLAMPRPPQIDRRHYFLGGPVKVGLNPVSRNEMYMFLLQQRSGTEWDASAQLWLELRQLLEGFGGILRDVRESLSAESRIIMRPLEAFFMPAPWQSGRVLLIGDAVHPTTPQLASGAGMAVEDALVLAEELTPERSVEQAFAAFMRRRYERCTLVVNNSLEIGRREQRGAPIAEQTELVQQTLQALAGPM
jgi:2-polyprenyl-6-methoxyphenol hydroxylase-like FAD-dependent oxidoreductase